ncbi:MAG: ATP-grasp domain-containing protein [Methylococcaceae bacterium]|jgi:predicted ATP-grasp superfamily ATP-dependent carboligase
MPSLQLPSTLLIIASSARMLAQSAHQVGIKVLVIDLFADLDTQGYAYDIYKAASLALADIKAILIGFSERYRVRHIVYGSGVEGFPESLDYLQKHFEILGNSAEVFYRVQDKVAFFSTLGRLQITFPPVSFTPPLEAAYWLEKPHLGQGGYGIKHYAGLSDKPAGNKLKVYWQQYLQGSSHSVLFLANGKKSKPIGFNLQWTQVIAGQDFVFAGVITDDLLPETIKAKLAIWLAQLTAIYALKGLNSLDFIYAGQSLYVLEINPRPSASMQLYNQNIMQGHLQACLGLGLGESYVEHNHCGYQIVYAQKDSIIPAQFQWPTECKDIPQAGALIRIGQPICSMIARAKSQDQVFLQLQNIQQQILKKLQE